MTDIGTLLGALVVATLGAVGLAVGLGAEVNWTVVGVAVPLTWIFIGVVAIAWRHRQLTHQRPQAVQRKENHD